MTSVFDLLENIRQRPTMYVGFDADHRREQLQALESILHGYELALAAHAIAEPGVGFLRRFADYLYERYGWSMSCGPIRGIRFESENDGAAWDRFWVLVDEFKRARHG